MNLCTSCRLRDLGWRHAGPPLGFCQREVADIMPRRPNDGVALNWEYKPGDKAEIEAIHKRLKAALS